MQFRVFTRQLAPQGETQACSFSHAQAHIQQQVKMPQQVNYTMKPIICVWTILASDHLFVRVNARRMFQAETMGAGEENSSLVFMRSRRV